MNKKKAILYLSIPIILIALVLTFSLSKEQKTVQYMANWIDYQESFSQALDNSTQVVCAKVINHNSYKRNEIVYTDTEIEVLETLKGDMIAGDICTVHFTGGTIDGVIYKMESLTIPNENEVYMFALREYNTENGPLAGHYLPIGGYQGIFKTEGVNARSIDANSISQLKIIPFNPDNSIEQEAAGKTLNEITLDLKDSE